MKAVENQFVVTKFRFFKVLIDDDFAQRLRLPNKFVYNFKETLPRVVELKTASGNIWNADLKQINGDMYLEAGWDEFVKAHSLNIGEFLIFKYKGNSQFKVLMFDTSTCEKECSCSFENNINQRCQGDCSTSRKKGQSSGEVSYTNFSEEDSEFSPSDYSATDSEYVSLERVSRKMSRSGVKAIRNGRFRSNCKKDEVITSTWDEAHMCNAKAENASKAEESKPMNQTAELTNITGRKLVRPAFKKVMMQSNVKGRFVLVIPSWFAKKYLPSKNQTFLIQNQDGKSWEVNCIYSDKMSIFCRGWKEYAMHNKLKVGDACVFELANDRDMAVFECHISRLENKGAQSIKNVSVT